MEKHIHEEDEISLKELILKLQEWWRYLLSKWIIILIMGVIGGAFGWTHAYFKKPLYTAKLNFVIEEEKPGGLSSLGSLAGQFGLDIGGSGGGVFAGDNLLAFMESRYIVQKSLLTSLNINGNRKSLADLYIEMNSNKKWAKEALNNKINFKPDADPAEFTLKQNSLINLIYDILIKNNLVIDKQDKLTSIIVIEVKSENELFSKYFTEVLEKEVSDFYVETKSKKSAENLAILQHQTDSVKSEFNSAISNVATSLDINPNPNPARQMLRAPSQRRQFDVQVNQAILTQLVQNLEIAKVSLRKETPFIQVIDRPVFPLPKEDFNKLNGFIAGGILGGFLAVFLIVIREILKGIMA